MEKNLCVQAIDYDIQRYEEFRKLTTSQSEDYTTGCLLKYDYIKTHYRLIAVDLSRQKELDVDSKAIQQIEFVGQLKKLGDDGNATDAGNDQSVFEKISKKQDQNIPKEINSIIKDGKLPRSET